MSAAFKMLFAAVMSRSQSPGDDTHPGAISGPNARIRGQTRPGAPPMAPAPSSAHVLRGTRTSIAPCGESSLSMALVPRVCTYDVLIEASRIHMCMCPWRGDRAGIWAASEQADHMMSSVGAEVGGQVGHADMSVESVFITRASERRARSAHTVRRAARDHRDGRSPARWASRHQPRAQLRTEGSCRSREPSLARLARGSASAQFSKQYGADSFNPL